MHVLMIVYHYWPQPAGGAERQCRLLSQALVRAGVKVTVLTGRTARFQPPREEDRGVSIVRVPLAEMFLRRPPVSQPSGKADGESGRDRRFLSWLQSFAVKLLRAVNILMFIRGARQYALRTKSFDLIHVHIAVWISGFAAVLGRRLGIPVLCKESTMPCFPQSPPYVPWRRHWDRLRSSNRFIALHPAMADQLADRGIPRGRIAVIPNGVEMPDWSKRCENPGRILFVGNLTQGLADKGLDTLMAAWAEVSRHLPGIRLILAGGGDPEEVRQMARSSGGLASVDFPGFVQNPATLYSEAALLVVPSRREGLSNVLLEAQAWGIPAVATDIPGNRAVVTNGENGLLVPAGEAQAMAMAVVRVMTDHELRIRMGQAARARIAADFEIGRIAQLVRKLYVQILENKM